MSVYGYLAFCHQHRCTKYPIEKSVVTIGRQEGSDIRILRKRIHRDHAKVESTVTEDGQIQNKFILINGDNNTVSINDQPMPKSRFVILNNKDTIVIAHKKFVFHTTADSLEPQLSENRRPKRRMSTKNFDMFCGIARKRRSSARLSNTTNHMSLVPLPTDQPLICFDESIASTTSGTKYFTVENIGDDQTEKSTLIDKNFSHFVTVAESLGDTELNTTVVNKPLIADYDDTEQESKQSTLNNDETIVANVTNHNEVDMSDEEDDAESVKQKMIGVETPNTVEVEVNKSASKTAEEPNLDAVDECEDTTKPTEDVSKMILPIDSAFAEATDLDDSAATYSIEPETIEMKEASSVQSEKTMDNGNVELSTIKDENNRIESEDEPANLNDSSETYTVEEPSMMATKCFSTPLLREKCSTPIVLKSLLKTNNKESPTSTFRKSVTFNRMIEENRSEYDKRTGTLLSSKISKKLFQTVQHIEEAESSPENEVKEVKESPVRRLVGSRPNRVMLGSPSQSTLKTYSATPPRASQAINVLVPRRTPSRLVPPTKSKIELDASHNGSIEYTAIKTLVQPKTPATVNDTNAASLKESKTTVTDETKIDGFDQLNQPKTPAADCNSKVKKLTPAKATPTTGSSLNLSGIRKVVRTPAQTPKADLVANVSGIKKQQMAGLKKVTQPKTPKSETNVDGLKHLAQPKTPAANYGANVTGIGKMMRTPTQTPKADYESNVDFGIKKLTESKTPKANYGTNVTGIGKMLRTPTQTPKADYESNVDFGIKKLTESKTPKANYGTNVTGIGKMLRTPAQTPKADYESNVDFGIKKLTESKTPKANYGANVTGIGKMLRTPAQTPKADYETNVDGMKQLTQPKTPTANYGANVTGIGKMMLTPSKTPKADYESNVDFGLKKMIESKTPEANYGANVTGIGKMMLTPSKTPKADYESNVDFGLKKMVEPKTPEANYGANVTGIGKMMRTPTKSPKADYESNVDFGIKKLTEPSTPLADYESNVEGMKELMQTPVMTCEFDCLENVHGIGKLMKTPTKSPKADYDTNVEGVKKLVQPSTPAADYESNVFGIKKMLATPSLSPKADYDTNVEGVKKLVQPGTPVANYGENVFGLKNLMRTPHNSPAADYVSNVAGVKKLTQPTTPTADYEENLYGLKKVFRTPTIVPIPDYESNLYGMGKMLHTPERSPIADYESNIAGVKRLTQPSTPEADYNLNVSRLNDLFDAIENAKNEDPNFLTPIKRVPTIMTRRARRMLDTPLTEDVEKTKPKEKESKPTRGRGRKRNEESDSNEEAQSTTRKTRRRKVPLDELAELCFDQVDEPKKKEVIDVVKNMNEKEKTSKVRATRATRSKKKKVESELESKLDNMDILNLDSDDMLEALAQTKPQRSTRKQKTKQVDVTATETPMEKKPKRSTNSRRKATKNSEEEAAETVTTTVVDEQENRPKTVGRKRLPQNRTFKVQLPQVDVSLKLMQSNPHNDMEQELDEEESARVTRSRRRY